MDKAYKPPKWIERMSMNDRLNYIVRMYSETCGDNWYLWIETAIETLPILIVSLLAVSKVDVIKEVLEAKYACGLRQALKTGSKEKRTLATKAKTFFWKIERVRGELFWYWLIAEAVTAYVINWQSIVVNEQRCNHPPHAGPCILTTPGSTLSSSLGAVGLFWDTAEYDPDHWSTLPSPGAPIAPNQHGNFNVGLSVECVWAIDADISWHCEIRDHIGRVVAVSATVTHRSSEPSEASCFAIQSYFAGPVPIFDAWVVVTQSPGGGFGHCISGTFSVGLQLT